MASVTPFLFDLLDTVHLVLGQEKGIVVGRAHYVDHAPGYLVRYLSGNGCQVEEWWTQSALLPASVGFVALPHGAPDAAS